MTRTPPEDDKAPLEGPNDSFEQVETAVSTDYKVLGQKDAPDGTGVLGHNTAATGRSYGIEGVTDSAGTDAAGVYGEAREGSGQTYGVRGVTNSPTGYGLGTPDDAKVDGTMATTGDWQVSVNGARALLLGSEGLGNAGNVVLGHSTNGVFDGAKAAAVGGGGFNDGFNRSTNEVYDHFGTVAGGEGNIAGDLDGDPTLQTHATVGGGENNTAGDSYATIGGGIDNTADRRATVGGGDDNAASSSWATVGGGVGNSASGTRATIGGGYHNTATSLSSTVAGGANNEASEIEAAVGGGLGNIASGETATVAGGESNTASAEDATVAGGFDNTAAAGWATVGGGGDNDAQAEFATIAGGGPSDINNPDTTNNVIYDNYGTIGGGGNNQAGTNDATSNAVYATVGGGRGNDAIDENATVGGGEFNDASGASSTVAGGHENIASGIEATVGGGDNNTASNENATVGGGWHNTASGHGSTVGGGSTNTASGGHSTVVGGIGNEANGEQSLAAGNNAVADHDGAFVWSDSSSDEFISTAVDQFLVEADGGTGIGTNDPVTTFHVKDSVADSGGDNLGRHVAAIENTSSSTSPVPDVLGLELTNVTDPGEFHSYISFMDSTGTIGNIQGDGNGGVEFVGALADFAEFFPKADPGQDFADGEVVSLRDGEVVAVDAEPEPDFMLVVSTAPLVTGNKPLEDDANREDYVKLSLVGQVPVRVSGSVDGGDVLVANPEGDGTAVARSNSEHAGAPVVGLAIGSHEVDDGTVGEVIALIGGPAPMAASNATRPSAGTSSIEEFRRELDRKDERIEELEADVMRLRSERTAFEERLSALETKASRPAASADD